MILRRCAWATSAFLVFAGISLAQTTGTIMGKVTEGGQPIKDALVKIQRKEVKGLYKVKTNKKGEYTYVGLPIGKYDVSVEVNGQVMDTKTDVPTTVIQPQEVNFDIKETKAHREALQKAAIAGTLTKEQERELTPEQKAAWEKQLKQQQAEMAKNKALNDAYNAGMTALQQADAAAPADKGALYSTAVESLKKAAEVDPNQQVVWSHLAEAYAGLGAAKAGAEQGAAYNAGLDAWTKAIALAPDDAALHNNYALALARAKRSQEAQAELQKAADLDPPNAGKYYYNLGALLVNSGQSEAAGEVFKKAIAADPNYADAHYQYGIYLISQAKIDAQGKIIPPPGTREEFETYLRLKPAGQFADAAKAMLQSMESQIQTTYVNPNAPPAKKTKKK